MSTKEQVCSIISFYFRTIESSNQISLLFPKELKYLISKYTIDLNIWDTSIHYNNTQFSNNNKTVTFHEKKVSVFGKKVYNLTKISSKLNIDFKITELTDNQIYFGLLDNKYTRNISDMLDELKAKSLLIYTEFTYSNYSLMELTFNSL